MTRNASCLLPLLGLLACASPPPATQAPPPVPPSASEAPVVPAPRSQPAAPATTPPQPGAAPGTSAPAVPSTPPRTSAPAPSVAQAPKAPSRAETAAPKKTPPTVAAAKPAVPAPAQAAAPTPQATLDLKTLERRLKETPAIGVMTKLSIKNQVDDLVERFRDFYEGRLRASLAELRRPYDLLVMKVMTLLQDGDPELARAVHASREAIWAMLADREKFARIAS